MKKRRSLSLSILFLVFAFASVSTVAVDDELKPCSQNASQRERLIREAEINEFRLKRIETSGNTYTRMRTFMKHATFNEGDIFTRTRLLENIRGFNKIKTIYPLRLSDVEIRLDRESKDIDVVFCVRQKEKK